MKDNIQFILGAQTREQGYKIEYNPDENYDELDVSVHEDDETTKKGQKPVLFSVEINGNKFKEFSFPPGQTIKNETADSPPKKINIFQFSIPASLFRTRENVVTIKRNRPAGPLTISTLEIFAKKVEQQITKVRLERAGSDETKDEQLWRSIKKHRLGFSTYEKFIDKILCKSKDLNGHHFDRDAAKQRSPFIRSEEYNLIKFATEFYMLSKFGLGEAELGSYISEGKLPYYNFIISRIKDDLTFSDITAHIDPSDCEKRERERIFNPFMIELIWSYWMEQGMLVQTLNVINLRFQNIKGNYYSDRLQRFDADPLRPLSHIIWGYVQDEQHRLSIPRRLNEYDHEYGLTLTGRAVPRITPVDSRVKFLEAFHSLLTLCTIYFKESDDTTRIADAFPILNSLKEVHLLLAEGNHNAYGNLTWTARQEMMMQQYILSRPEMREFLGGRVMVPYAETWMDRVDTMRNIQGWGGSGIVHYYELAIHGEMILLSIRYGNWSDVNLDRNNAANWAQEFRNSVQRYIHAYRSVTGVDLSVDQIIQLAPNFAIQPAYLIQQRLLDEKARTRRA